MASLKELQKMAFVQALMADAFMQEDKCKELYSRIVNKPRGTLCFDAGFVPEQPVVWCACLQNS